MNEDKGNIFLELQSAIEMLNDNYLSTNDKKVSEEVMVRNGLAAMMATLGDAFTNYIPPVQLTSYQSRKAQTVVGIGLVADFDREGKARVVAALEGAPADRPDVPTGAEIFRVNGKNIRKTDLRLLTNHLNGPEGSSAKIELILENGESSVVEIERKTVNVEHIRFHVIDDEIVFIRIAWFSGTCYQDFLEKLTEYVSRGIKGIILDVRSNSGGSIISTRNIFSAICEEEVMYYCRKVANENIKDRVLGEHKFDLPVVLILNEATFSAGEVLAGALKDYGRASLVGEKSGGKGSMQQVFPLEGRIAGALRVTTATNCTPNGYVIQGNGIQPDHRIELELAELFVDDGAQNYSNEGRVFLKKLRAEKLTMLHGREKVDQVQQDGDKQKRKAIEILREKIRTGK